MDLQSDDIDEFVDKIDIKLDELIDEFKEYDFSFKPLLNQAEFEDHVLPLFKVFMKLNNRHDYISSIFKKLIFRSLSNFNKLICLVDFLVNIAKLDPVAFNDLPNNLLHAIKNEDAFEDLKSYIYNKGRMNYTFDRELSKKKKKASSLSSARSKPNKQRLDVSLEELTKKILSKTSTDTTRTLRSRKTKAKSNPKFQPTNISQKNKEEINHKGKDEKEEKRKVKSKGKGKDEVKELQNYNLKEKGEELSEEKEEIDTSLESEDSILIKGKELSNFNLKIKKETENEAQSDSSLFLIEDNEIQKVRNPNEGSPASSVDNVNFDNFEDYASSEEDEILLSGNLPNKRPRRRQQRVVQPIRTTDLSSISSSEDEYLNDDLYEEDPDEERKNESLFVSENSTSHQKKKHKDLGVHSNEYDAGSLDLTTEKENSKLRKNNKKRKPEIDQAENRKKFKEFIFDINDISKPTTLCKPLYTKPKKRWKYVIESNLNFLYTTIEKNILPGDPQELREAVDGFIYKPPKYSYFANYPKSVTGLEHIISQKLDELFNTFLFQTYKRSGGVQIDEEFFIHPLEYSYIMDNIEDMKSKGIQLAPLLFNKRWVDVEKDFRRTKLIKSTKVKSIWKLRVFSTADEYKKKFKRIVSEEKAEARVKWLNKLVTDGRNLYFCDDLENFEILMNNNNKLTTITDDEDDASRLSNFENYKNRNEDKNLKFNICNTAEKSVEDITTEGDNQIQGRKSFAKDVVSEPYQNVEEIQFTTGMEPKKDHEVMEQDNSKPTDGDRLANNSPIAAGKTILDEGHQKTENSREEEESEFNQVELTHDSLKGEKKRVRSGSSDLTNLFGDGTVTHKTDNFEMEAVLQNFEGKDFKSTIKDLQKDDFYDGSHDMFDYDNRQLTLVSVRAIKTSCTKFVKVLSTKDHFKVLANLIFSGLKVPADFKGIYYQKILQYSQIYSGFRPYLISLLICDIFEFLTMPLYFKIDSILFELQMDDLKKSLGAVDNKLRLISRKKDVV